MSLAGIYGSLQELFPGLEIVVMSEDHIYMLQILHKTIPSAEILPVSVQFVPECVIVFPVFGRNGVLGRVVEDGGIRQTAQNAVFPAAQGVFGIIVIDEIVRVGQSGLDNNAAADCGPYKGKEIDVIDCVYIIGVTQGHFLQLEQGAPEPAAVEIGNAARAAHFCA